MAAAARSRGGRRHGAIVGVDVGGTTTAVGLVTPDGDVIADASAPTRAGERDPLETIVGLMAEVTERAGRAARAIAAVGVGVPGPVDAERGIVGDPVTHVAELAGRPLAAELGGRVGLPVFVDNDVNALALGEATLGAARGARSLVVLSTGTGIGAGIVLEGRLVRGAAGFGGELGHAPVKFDGPRCWCGLRGCLALYASGRGIADIARSRVGAGERSTLLAAAGGDPAGITAAVVFSSAQGGDGLAGAIVEEATRALGAMIGTIVNGLNPEVLIVTGGVVESFARLEPKILSAAREYAFPRALAATRVEIVVGDKRASVRGAAALALYEQTIDSRRTR
ncbi:MAG: transcriptional regulator [Candidatus Rokuibacteriota bacterium]|nr:MAG: transcriptional regulator [Candidatus Rokubacteria bacterium]